MAFSPYSTPVQYEYKPLNLSAFMIPLAKMQEQFDTTEAAVKGSTVTIANLPYGTDPKKAEELINTYNEKRDELAKNLIESKNYKQAAIKLKELNTTWLKDPEKAGLESNYAIYKDMLKTADENVKSGYWSQQRANQWLERSRREYKGAEFKADYENPTGKYTTYGRTARVKDLEKEREELAWKIASAIPAQKGDAFRAAGIDVELMDKKFVKTITEEKDANVIAQRVSEYLKTLPRFKEEAIEVADYNFADLTQNPERAQEYQEVAADLNDKYLNGVNYQLARLEKEAEKDKNILKSTEYKDLLAEKENAVKAKTTGEYDPTATKNLFVNQHLNDVYDMGALGKVLAYKNVTHEYTFRDIPKPTGPGEGGDGTGLALGKDAFFHPETDVTYHIPAFQKQMQTAAQGLFPVLRQLNSFGKGNVRTAIYSNLSAEDKEAMAKNPAIGIARNKNLLTAFATSKDLKSFMSNAGAKGIKMTKENASTIFKYFSAPNGTGIKQFKEILESAAPYEQAFNSASTNLKNVRAEVQGSTEYKSAINNLGNMSPAILVNRDQMVSAPKALQAVYRNQIALFNGTTYSPEQLKRAGISIPAGRTFHQLTFNDVSKLAGFKNVNKLMKDSMS